MEDGTGDHIRPQALSRNGRAKNGRFEFLSCGASSVISALQVSNREHELYEG